MHPSARVVSFSSASSLRSRPSSRSSVASYDGEGDGSASLPWTSPTERTMAAGPLEIYRVPGSVAFLHSGSLLHAILPRSQCWCVDGVSKFAMRVLPNTYYRIELPGTTQEDLDHVEQLKKTLATVLYYERTACPFDRGFGHDLPEMPSRGSRRSSREFIEPAKRWRLDKIWRPEGAELEVPELLHPDRSYYTSDTDRSEAEETGKSEAEESGNEQPARPVSRDKPTQLSGPFPSKRMAAMRSVTAPPQLSLESSPPSKIRVRKMAGLFNQAARDTTLTPPRPTLVPKLPPTPESISDGQESVPESSDEHTPKGSLEDESVETEQNSNDENDAALTTEPLIIVEHHDDDAEPDTPVATQPTAFQHERFQLEAEKEAASQDQADAETAQEQEGKNTPTTSTTEQTSLPNLDQGQDQPPTDLDATSPSTSTTETTSAIFSASSPALSTTSHSTTTSWSTLPVLTPSEATDLLRQRHQPSPSSSPPPASTPSPQTQQQHLTKQPTTPALLVRKTCALFLGPPANLVATMLRIAARLVASGALNLAEPAFHDMFVSNSAAAAVAGRLRGHRRVPGSWDLSDDDEDWGF